MAREMLWDTVDEYEIEAAAMVHVRLVRGSACDL